MIRLLALILTQSVLLVAAQTLLKIAVQAFGKFTFTWSFIVKALTTWQFFASGVCAVSCLIVWMYTLRHYDFSLAYPLLSVSYIIGLFAAYFILGEAVPYTRWIGVLIIMVGVYFVLK